MLSCAGRNVKNLSPEEKPHSRQDWILLRAAHFGILPSEAEKRDLLIREDTPFREEDEELKKEAALIWRDMCALCHGIDGDPSKSLLVEPKPKKLGGFAMRMGFFFGGDAMRTAIYKIIRDGKGRMPGFAQKLSREQMWAMVRYLERM
ncbi:MAG: cytochrome c [Leptospiraceae bacterium]|nr:cytochrome c [Leptospiraceae bacterium]MDW8306932.1 cytochrome c [Leptospiraceae bacterium]